MCKRVPLPCLAWRASKARRVPFFRAAHARAKAARYCRLRHAPAEISPSFTGSPLACSPVLPDRRGKAHRSPRAGWRCSGFERAVPGVSDRDQASLRSNRSNAVAMISVDFLRFCFALSLGSRESSASNISISGIGVSLRRFNSWSSFASWSCVIGAFFHFLPACRLGFLCGHLGQDLPSYSLHELLHHLFVRLVEPAGFGRRRGDARLLLGVLHHVEQYLGSA